MSTTIIYPSMSVGPAGATGPQGAAGANGQNAYTTTTGSFTMPAVSSTVSIPVVNSLFAIIGMVVYIATAGAFQVSSIPDGTHIVASNLGYPGNASPTTVIATNQEVSPSGLQGAIGPTGPTGPQGPAGTNQTSMPTPNLPWFAPSSVQVVAPVSGQPAGDPFIVWDTAVNQFRMYFYTAPGGIVQMNQMTAPTLEGPWTSPTAISGMTNYHKMVVLVDTFGNPVKMSNLYHAYAVYYNGSSLASKDIVHFTASTLAGPWTAASTVIPIGASGTWDGYNTDAPYALYDGITIRMWYMAAPNTSQVDFGLNMRIMIATGTAPDGPFTKNYTTAALTPGTSGAWDGGWVGGTQVRQMFLGGPYVMLYGAGNNSVVTAGVEIVPTLGGAAYSFSLDGPWTKFPSNPMDTLTNIPSTALENTAIWRHHIAYDPMLGRWYCYYNTGYGTVAGEQVTFGRANVYGYQYYPTPGTSGGNIQNVTTTETTITNSSVYAIPGVYRVTAQAGVIADSSGATNPALVVQPYVRLNGTHIANYLPQPIFVGSYAYDNKDFFIDSEVVVTTSGYIDLSVKVTGGTPGANSWLRDLRYFVTRLQ